MRDLRLSLYAGRYHLEWYWRDGKHVIRFLDVTASEGELTAQTQTATLPIDSQSITSRHLVERRSGERYVLTGSSVHTFDAVGTPRQHQRRARDAPLFAPRTPERRCIDWKMLGYAGYENTPTTSFLAFAATG
jgi:hypothetical protein